MREPRPLIAVVVFPGSNDDRDAELALTRLGADARRVWHDELPTLAGHGDLLPLVAAAMADFGVTAPLHEVFRAIWLQIEPAEESIALVRALRGRKRE